MTVRLWTASEMANAVDFHQRKAATHAAIATALTNGTYDALVAYSDAYVPVSFVCERLGIPPQAANNRLRQLVDRGVCRRRYANLGNRAQEYHWIAQVGS